MIAFQCLMYIGRHTSIQMEVSGDGGGETTIDGQMSSRLNR